MIQQAMLFKVKELNLWIKINTEMKLNASMWMNADMAMNIEMGMNGGIRNGKLCNVDGNEGMNQNWWMNAQNKIF